MNFKNLIKTARPTLSDSSILKNLYKKVFGEKEISFDDFDNGAKILMYLENTEPDKRKTILST